MQEETFTIKQMTSFGNYMQSTERFMSVINCENLEKNYDYLVSDEAVRETIELNEYTFTENGRIEN